MLVLGRKVDEAIVMTLPDGSEIRISVEQFRRFQGGTPDVVIGIDAPKSVKVMREELVERDAYVGKGER